MQNRLRIYFRHKQLYKDQDVLQPIIVQCNVDGTAEYVPGLVDQHDWTEMTKDTEGLEDFDLSWQAQTESYGENVSEVSASGSNYSKGLSVELRFFGAAFNFIESWLMLNPCQSLNSVEVKVTDTDCQKNYRVFELKLDNTEYAPYDEPCIVSMPLREKDDVWHSFQKTIIEDNWQNWFNKEGTSVKTFPTFSYIVEKKPKFILAFFVVLIYLVGMLSAGILIALSDGKRWIRRSLGFTYFCPAPRLNEYIQNICSKFGYTFNTIFDDVPGNPYRDVCLFWPASSSYKNFDDFDSPDTRFIWDNRTVLSFSKFLNQLKKVFNAEWYVTPNNELVFQHKSYFDNLTPIYDFTLPNTDELTNLVYSFNGKKKPAYGDYQYRIDPQDTCSNEVKWRYNAIVDFDGDKDNPLLEGHVDKSFDFAATAFNHDGSSEDFIKEAVTLGRLVAVGALLVGLTQLFIATGGFTVAIAAALLATGYAVTNGYVNDFFDNPELNGIVRVAASEINVPRLLMYDRDSPENKARVVKIDVPPAPNPYYNPTLRDYYTEHPTYEQPGYFGTVVTEIYNYPMFVEEMYFGNLYDQFHEYDNPLKNPVINQTWKGNVDLCCEWLDRLGVWENDFVKIGGVVILENRNGRLIKGRITEIKPSYKTGRINLSGDVMK